MGNWRHRRPRRFDRQDIAPKYPPSYHVPESSFSEFSNDGVPLWEKKFCTLVGKVSWRKIVDAKNFTSHNNNVLNWDDSAGEEAFRNAKSQYWAKINGFSCDISAPDPNAYIEEINWNPYIDPELIRELEREYFAPPTEVEEDSVVEHENKITRNLSSAPTEECNTIPSKVDDNPWESNNVTQGSSKDFISWGHLVLKVDDARNGNNPWESSITQGNESGKHNSWGDYGSRDWNTGNNSWGHSYKGIDSKMDDGWGDFKRTSWGRNRQDAKELPNRNNSWERSYVQHNAGCDGNSWGRKAGGNHDVGSRKLDYKSSSSGGAWHSGSRKREGFHQYTPDYKSSRFQQDDNQGNHYWRNTKSNKRVSFVRE